MCTVGLNQKGVRKYGTVPYTHLLKYWKAGTKEFNGSRNTRPLEPKVQLTRSIEFSLTNNSGLGQLGSLERVTE
jgi:hypothetical protein